MESKRAERTLSKSLEVWALGPVDKAITEYVAEHVSNLSGLPSRVGPGMDLPGYAFDENRGQYNSKVILKRLISLSRGQFRLLAVTPVDLFVPILKYVFGLAQVGGPCAIISTYRLYPQFYGGEPDRKLLMDRVGKTALHEFGHSLGLTHCRNRRCVMYSSVKIEDTDLKRSGFCSTCLELLRWYLER